MTELAGTKRKTKDVVRLSQVSTQKKLTGVSHHAFVEDDGIVPQLAAVSPSEERYHVSTKPSWCVDIAARPVHTSRAFCIIMSSQIHSVHVYMHIHTYMHVHVYIYM